MQRHVIRLENVSVDRGARRLLTQVQWTVDAGQQWVVVGANGSGKTTLLNLITGYWWPSQGHVEVLGHRFGTIDLRELRKSIGWVGASLSEWYGQHHPSDTVRDVVLSGHFATIGSYQRPSSDLIERAHRLLQQFGLEGLAEQRFGVLSQGERQRTLVARAWMAKPRLLILDEPASGLDLVAREALLATVDALGRQPDAPSMIYVTHHVEEIVPVFTHALLLQKGRVLGQGVKQDILDDRHLSGALGIAVHVNWVGQRPWVVLGGLGM